MLRSAAHAAGRPRRWWARQSLRGRLTLIATLLFTFAVVTGAVLLLVIQRYSLYRVLDQSATRTGNDIAAQVHGRVPDTVLPTTGGIYAVQVLNSHDQVLTASPGADRHTPVVSRRQLLDLRRGARITIQNPTSGAPLRVLARPSGSRTVVVLTDLSRIQDSLRLLGEAALIGGPIAVLLMAVLTYAVVSITLRPVAALRHGAADITAAGLAEQRLPIPGPQDEIHRLAITLNAMLDRIDSATSKQRTFVGDAAHELRSPLASLRVQLEVSQRLGPDAEWAALVDDVLIDVGRLDRLVEDLLALARLDEARGLRRRQPVALDEVVAAVVAGYGGARVPVTLRGRPVVVDGDPDALRRVATNLIDNATRYASAAVDVAVGPDHRGDTPVAVLSVVDDGPGIPADERVRVFDRFYRVQESRSRESGGTGLGLPIVRDIVRSHGGRVRLTARRDDQPGLRAVVVLPAQ